MTQRQTHKQVIVVSDTAKLHRIIDLGLRRYPGVISVEFILLAPGEDVRLAAPILYDLVILALSSSASEPVVALAQAGLAHEIGRAPILIISDRPAADAPENRIAHLDFPFDIAHFYDKVEQLLCIQPLEGGPPALAQGA